jgi:hypothetical protein
MTMHKASIVTVFALALVGSIAIAAKPQFKASPTFTDNGTTMSVTGSLAGLGGGDLEISLQATGTETAVCGVPGGMDPPPKQVVLTGAMVVAAPVNQNGPAMFEGLTSTAPPAPACAESGGDAMAAQHDVGFTNVSVQIRPVQPDPLKAPLKPVRCIQCSFNLPTVDGPATPQSCFTTSTC